MARPSAPVYRGHVGTVVLIDRGGRRSRVIPLVLKRAQSGSVKKWSAPWACGRCAGSGGV
jgi:hypothetical protein